MPRCIMVALNVSLRWLLALLILHGGLADEKEEPFQCHTLEEFDAAKNPVGDIYSPFYGERAEYPSNLWCESRITAPEGYRLKLTFKDLDIEPSGFCSEDGLTIYANDREYVIDVICGSEKPEPIITAPGVNIAHFLFRTDQMSSGRGYHIQYEASPNFEKCVGLKECGNGKCYDEAKQKCDGVDDCGDGSDEEGCNYPLPTSECGLTPIAPDTIFGKGDRIIGGKQAIPNSWPWQVSLQSRNGAFSHSCGGSLINAQWIVTAAHCIKGKPRAEDHRIHLGKHHKFEKSPYEQIRYGERIIVWPDKTGDNLMGASIDMTHDIALIKLNAPIKFNDGVRPICLPSLGWTLPPGAKCYATGWGETRGTGSNEALKQVDVSILSKDNCTFDKVSQICVKNSEGFQSTCHGDSGGPLSCKLAGKWYVFGAVSYGTLGNLLSGLCAMPEQRTVFMGVPGHADWIRKMVEIYS